MIGIIDRSSGILMHISSLPGRYGIGDLGKEAYDFVDFLVKAGQKNWQVLPIGVTGFGDSPYQCFSAFAGNPYFIDLNEFIQDGYLTKRDIEGRSLYIDEERVDYKLLYENKMSLLQMAYDNAKRDIYEELRIFYEENIDWLRKFSIFMSIKKKYSNSSWLKWDKAYRIFDSSQVLEFEKNNLDHIYFWIFTQYMFFEQWRRLKKYANDREINIIGDLPIYVAEDSSDVWGNPELFNLDDDLYPLTISGCPPDDFSETGQLWGNPIYNWRTMEDLGYSWWIHRVEHSFKLFNILRVDHFRGFESYWEVEYGSKDAIDGSWVKGPGLKLFKKIEERLGKLNIIVEDLGLNTVEVERMVIDSGFPNMRVIQFGLDLREDNTHTPHYHDKNCTVYTGTHDNHTIMGWIETLSYEEFQYVSEYFKLDEKEGFNWGIIRGTWASTANLAIAPMQDFLGLGDESRMNIPGTRRDNWTWRMKEDVLSDELAKRIRNLTEIYWR